MELAYAGIDLAIAKKKRLPVVVCTLQDGQLAPIRLRDFPTKPPLGRGNVKALEDALLVEFAEEVVEYLRRIESTFEVAIERVAIDAPRTCKAAGTARRQCEIALDRLGIHCFATPDAANFTLIKKSAAHHIGIGGSESKLPGANLLWMLAGFQLFDRLRQNWDCIEVFPQAIAWAIGANGVHKSRDAGFEIQLGALATRIGWLCPPTPTALKRTGYGRRHDLLDALMATWVASMNESQRRALGSPPDDVIWIPSPDPASAAAMRSPGPKAG